MAKTLFLLACLIAAARGFGGHTATKSDDHSAHTAQEGDDILSGTGVSDSKKSDHFACQEAGPQSPRDVTAGSTGQMTAGTPVDSVDNLVHVNTHFHLGAEHKSTGEYDEPMNFGYSCKAAAATLQPDHLKPYDFKYCHDVEVGQTYEFHWVYSSGGVELGEGLGGAFSTSSEPTIVVQGQVFVVVNDVTGAFDQDLLHGGTFNKLGTDVAMYMGSTTGTKYNNDDSCSPYSINWHVDRKCQFVSAKSLDDVCRRKIDMNMKGDIHPHGSREIVSNSLSADTLYTKN